LTAIIWINTAGKSLITKLGPNKTSGQNADHNSWPWTVLVCCMHKLTLAQYYMHLAEFSQRIV